MDRIVEVSWVSPEYSTSQSARICSAFPNTQVSKSKNQEKDFYQPVVLESCILAMTVPTKWMHYDFCLSPCDLALNQTLKKDLCHIPKLTR